MSNDVEMSQIEAANTYFSVCDNLTWRAVPRLQCGSKYEFFCINDAEMLQIEAKILIFLCVTI
jgi:hypothetical protein